MEDRIRVTVSTGDAEQTVTVYDSEGAVSAGDATFRFCTGGADDGAGAGDERERNADAADADGDGSDAAAGDPRHVAPLDEVPTDGTLLFEARRGRRGTEGILRRDGETALAWRNACPHEPDVRLDEGFGARVTDDHIVCHKHGARFVCGDGFCTRGPCRGQSLEPILVEVRDDQVYLTDERFESGHRLDA